MEPLVSLLIFLLVAGVVAWLIICIIDMLPLPHPFGVVAKAVLLLILVLILVQRFLLPLI